MERWIWEESKIIAYKRLSSEASIGSLYEVLSWGRYQIPIKLEISRSILAWSVAGKLLQQGRHNYKRRKREVALELRHCLHSDRTSPKPGKKRRATLVIFVMVFLIRIRLAFLQVPIQRTVSVCFVSIVFDFSRNDLQLNASVTFQSCGTPFILYTGTDADFEQFSGMSISIAVPPLWNKLPPSLRQLSDPSYALTKTPPLAISSQLFHHKTKNTVLQLILS